MNRPSIMPVRRRSRASGAFALAATAALLLSACTGPASTTPSDTEAKDTLRIGSDITYPPFIFFEGSTVAGFDADLMRAITDEMGVTPEFIDTRFEQLILGIQSDKFDIIASALRITAERAQKVDYVAYASIGNAIVSRTDATPTRTFEDLCGKKVGVIKGAAVVVAMAEDSDKICAAAGKGAIEILEFTVDSEASQALLSKQIDVQVSDMVVADEIVKKTNGQLEVTSDSLLYPASVGLAVKKGNSALADKVQAALDTLRSNGSYQKLLDKYGLKDADQAVVDAELG